MARQPAYQTATGLPPSHDFDYYARVASRLIGGCPFPDLRSPASGQPDLSSPTTADTTAGTTAPADPATVPITDAPSYDTLTAVHTCASFALEDHPLQRDTALQWSGWVKAWCAALLSRTGETRYDDLYWAVLRTESPVWFDSYCLYMEQRRPYAKKFYLPRRKTLRPVAADLQRLDDSRDLRFYGLSLPPRVGKSTLCIFFMSWIMGRRPNSHSAMGGHSGILAKGFHQELLNLIESPEYCFYDIFPKSRIQRKNADYLEINLGHPDRFATMTCRGIDGTWTGSIDVSADGYLYVDDLIRDRQHSLSPTRLDTTYQEYLNKMVDRKNDGSKELMVGTRWNVVDPLGRIRAYAADDPRYFFREIPALDPETDESNFDYNVKGFSTEYFRDVRARLDQNEWAAKYQQKPFIREGLLFPDTELRYYNGVLPEGDSRVIAAVDVAWGGGDALSMPVGREYANGDVYIIAWVFSRGTKETTLPLVTGQIVSNEIRRVNFEANTGGGMYRRYVDEELHKQHYQCSCTDTYAPTNMEKMTKIIACSGDIKRRFIFLDPDHQDSMYRAAMDELTFFVQLGKNEHDDAADSLSQLMRFIEGPAAVRPAVIMQSPF